MESGNGAGRERGEGLERARGGLGEGWERRWERRWERGWGRTGGARVCTVAAGDSVMMAGTTAAALADALPV